MSDQSSKTFKASFRYSIGMFSPGEARSVCRQAWDQSRIVGGERSRQNWFSDYQGMKSLMFFKASDALLNGTNKTNENPANQISRS